MLDVDKSIKVDGLEKSIIDKCKQRIIAVAVIFFVSFIIVNIKLIDTSKPLKAKEKIVRDINSLNSCLFRFKLTKYIAIIEGFIGWFLLGVFIVSLLNQMSNI